ncbi:MAG TPA: O-antigen ligase family protein [Candidatus Eremiobacteraceae bacterium]|nr:O-antigen ligase family protein [Candidatus Eremiobacteraceae bacterium]
MIDTRALVYRPFWPVFWRWTGISLGVGAAVLVAFIGFNLAMAPTGCPMFWNVFAIYCGTHTGMALAACLFMIPLAGYFAIKRPWLFPVSLYALLVPSDSYLNFTSFTGGSSLTKVAAILATGSMMWYLARNKRFVDPGKAVVAWLVYGAWASMTMLWGYDVEDNTLILWGTLWQLIFFYVILAVARIEEDEFRVIMTSWIIGNLFASVFGATVFGFGGAKFDNAGRLKAHFNPDNKLLSDLFSASFVFPVALMTMYILRINWGLKKIGLLLVYMVLLVGQFVVGSRGGILADGLVLVYFFLKGRYRGQLMFLAALAFTVSFAFPTATWGRILKPDPSGGSGRIEIWKVGWAALKDHWIFGGGFAQFENLYDKYFLTVWNQFYEHWHRGPHNIILQAWVEQGLIGLGIMLLAWWMTYKSMAHIPPGHPRYDERIAVEAGVFGAFVAGIFVGIMLSKFTFWMMTMVSLYRQVTLRSVNADQASKQALDHVVVLDTGPPPELEPLPVPGTAT